MSQVLPVNIPDLPNVERLQKLSALLRNEADWPDAPNGTVKTNPKLMFDLSSWFDRFTRRRWEERPPDSPLLADFSADDFFGPQKKPRHTCGTTACACGLYALAYPEDGLKFDVPEDRMPANAGGGVEIEFTDKLRPGDYMYSEDLDADEDDQVKTFSGLNAAKRFFGLDDWYVKIMESDTLLTTVDVADFLFLPNDIWCLNKHDPNDTARRVDWFIDLLENGSPIEVELATGWQEPTFRYYIAITKGKLDELAEEDEQTQTGIKAQRKEDTQLLTDLEDDDEEDDDDSSIEEDSELDDDERSDIDDDERSDIED